MAIYKDVEPLEVFAWESENEDFDKGVKFALEKLDTLPTADVVEVEYSDWVYNGKPIHCKRCGYSPEYSLNKKNSSYCPNCGAKMDGDSQ